MDTIDPNVADAWVGRHADLALRNMIIELESERAQVKSWSRHYDDLHRKYEKLCDALYVIIGLESHELDQGPWTARSALQDVGEWPR